jgi:hypothetical protein
MHYEQCEIEPGRARICPAVVAHAASPTPRARGRSRSAYGARRRIGVRRGRVRPAARSCTTAVAREFVRTRRETTRHAHFDEACSPQIIHCLAYIGRTRERRMNWLAGTKGLKRFGYIVTAWGLLSFGANYVAIAVYGFPHDMGIALGNGAITLAGLIAIMSAKCIGDLDRRMTALERDRTK